MCLVELEGMKTIPCLSKWSLRLVQWRVIYPRGQLRGSWGLGNLFWVHLDCRRVRYARKELVYKKFCLIMRKRKRECSKWSQLGLKAKMICLEWHGSKQPSSFIVARSQDLIRIPSIKAEIFYHICWHQNMHNIWNITAVIFSAFLLLQTYWHIYDKVFHAYCP